MTARPVFIGIDLGTTRTKVGVMSAHGEALGFARAEQASDVDPDSGRAEQAPDSWWEGLGLAIRGAAVGRSLGR